jgi:tight adherence protein B
MLLIVFAICLIFFAAAVLVIVTFRSGPSKRVNMRLAALDHEFAPTDQEETAADIQRPPQRLTASPWLNRWLARMNLAAKASLFLYQANVKTTLGSLVLASLTLSAVLGYAWYWQSGQAFTALLVFAACLPLPFAFVQRMRTKRLFTLEQQLPEALSMVVSALRVGHSLVASLGAVAQESPDPIAGEMRKCFEEQNYGVDLRTSLTNLTRRVPVQDYRIFVAAVMVQKESGGNLAEVLDKVALTARERFRLKKQVSVHTAQGRMTGWILSFLPVIIGLAMYLMNPDGMSVLWKSETGLKMLYVATGMDVVGALIIRKIVNIRV